MPRKPAHIAAAGPRQDRQAIWEAMRTREGACFSVNDIRGQLHGATSTATIRTYCNSLAAAGYLKRTESVFKRANEASVFYRLVKDAGVDAPRVTKDGREVTQGQGQENMWRAMPILGEFDTYTLASYASSDQVTVAESAAYDYCKWLARAGYLIASGKGRYRFVPAKNTGPRPPEIQRIKQVFDPNTGEVVYQARGGRQ